MIELDLLSIRFSEVMKDGFIGFQPDRFGDNPGGRTYEGLFPFGDFGRPLDPDPAPDGNGAGCTGLVARVSDRDASMMACHDPRFAWLLPDPGKGGRGNYGCVDLCGGKRVVAYQLFYGAGVQGITPGSFVVRVPTADGKEHRIDIDLGNNRVRITHADGVLVELTADGVHLGATGGKAVLVNDASWATFFADVQADRKSTRLNSSHSRASRMPSSA